jgi:hypothetical protein
MRKDDKILGADAAEGANAGSIDIPKLTHVGMPPPCDQDYQVSKIDGPDYDPAHFMGGVEAIERNGPLLIFKFVGGGQVCVNGGVTYQAPEHH